MRAPGCLALLAAAGVAAGCGAGRIDDGGGGGGGTAGGDGGTGAAADARPGTGPGGADAAPGTSGEPAGLVGITDEHNKIRATVGVGPMMWDPDLAATAQAWADGCVDNDAPIGLVDHNPNRSDGHPWPVGENVFGSGAPTSGIEAVDTWASEAQYYDYNTNTCASGQICGHYTQVVWATSTHLGCGISHCADLTYGYTVVCDYGPAGNDGGRPY